MLAFEAMTHWQRPCPLLKATDVGLGPPCLPKMSRTPSQCLSPLSSLPTARTPSLYTQHSEDWDFGRGSPHPTLVGTQPYCSPHLSQARLTLFFAWNSC